ncbi:MAG: hypothetical protein IT260_07115 [Saprospiraceae bacterium]|nr:hypothetical protein [Saprospiraceae bacterium]
MQKNKFMRAPKFTTVLLLVFPWLGCQEADKNWHQPDLPANYEILLQLECANESNNQGILDSAKAVILRRLASQHVYYRSIEMDGQQLRLNPIGREKEAANPSPNELRALTNMVRASGSLTFSELYHFPRKQFAEQLLPRLLKDSIGFSFSIMPPVTGFVALEEYPALVAWFQQPQNQAFLPAGVELALGQKSEQFYGRELFPVYFLKKSATPNLSEAHLKEIQIMPREGDDSFAVLTMRFDQKGTQLLTDLSTRAYEADQMEIAILLNDFVVSTPKVMTPIRGGNVSIDGGFSVAEGHAMLALLENGRLPCPVQLIESKIVER